MENINEEMEKIREEEGKREKEEKKEEEKIEEEEEKEEDKKEKDGKDREGRISEEEKEESIGESIKRRRMMIKRKKEWVKPEIKIKEIAPYPEEQICYFRDTKFTNEQLNQIVLGFSYGLTPEEVASYAKYENSDIVMGAMRREIMNNKGIN